MRICERTSSASSFALLSHDLGGHVLQPTSGINFLRDAEVLPPGFHHGMQAIPIQHDPLWCVLQPGWDIDSEITIRWFQ